MSVSVRLRTFHSLTVIEIQRRRWWLLLSHSYQTGAIILVCILLSAGCIDNRRPSRFTAIVLLSSSSGFQVAMARELKVPEIPTAMRESPSIPASQPALKQNITITAS